MKITVIQLLNKVANGEEIPKKIKYKNFEYIYSLEISWYRRIDDIGSYDEWFINVNRLNDEVEIIEDIEDINIQDICELPEYGYNDDDIRRIINELVQAVKQLEKTKEEK